MKNTHLLCFLIPFLFLNLLTFADEIDFYEFDFPPYRIAEGEFIDKGVLDYVRDNFIEEFSDYQINMYVSNNERALSDMEKKPNVLFSAGLRTREREQVGIFSVPYLLLLPNGIIMNKANYDKILPYLNEIGEVQLERLITDSDLKGGLSLSRVYGGIIDETLNKHRYSENIGLGLDATFEKNFKKVKDGTLDYVLGYPIEAGYFTRKDKGLPEDFVSLNIEGMPEVIMLYSIFSKGDLGEEIMPKLNVFLENIIKQKEFHDNYEYWLDEESIKRYRTYVEEVFGITY